MILPAYSLADEPVGFVQIKCSPGIDVYLDGVYLGVTSSELDGLIIRDVPIGQHKIKLSKEGYKPYETSVNVISADVSQIDVKQLKPKRKDVGQIADLDILVKQFLKSQQYNKIIKILEDKVQDKFCSNRVLGYYAQALLGKGEHMKRRDDSGYEELAYESYAIGERMIRRDEKDAKGYYISARSLLINDRPDKACRYLEKAVYFSPNNFDYQMVLGDAFYRRALDTMDEDLVYQNLEEAKSAYKKAMELCEGNKEKHDMVKSKLEKVRSKLQRQTVY